MGGFCLNKSGFRLSLSGVGLPLSHPSSPSGEHEGECTANQQSYVSERFAVGHLRRCWRVQPAPGQRGGYDTTGKYQNSENTEPQGTGLEEAFHLLDTNSNIAAIRRAVRDAGFETPVIVTGGVHGFEKGERILQEGKADIVGIARQALADPDFFLKVRAGCGSEVRVCEYTNYCEGLDQKHKQVTCKLWDRKELDEPGVKRTLDGKRRTTAPAWSGPA